MNNDNIDESVRPFIITTTTSPTTRKKYYHPKAFVGIIDDEISSLSGDIIIDDNNKLKEKKKKTKIIPSWLIIIMAIIIIIILMISGIAIAVGTTLMTTNNNNSSLVDGGGIHDRNNNKNNNNNNVCAGKKLDFPNVQCIVDGLTNVGLLPQAAANVTIGYNGTMDVDVLMPITDPFYTIKDMCPVNVHWHLGSEHYSVGQYDDDSTGGNGPPTTTSSTLMDAHNRREGHKCTMYDSEDPKFTKPYQWKYCKSMEVGQTYEIHWPYSAFGACSTVNQYQTPFLDGIFCNLDMETFESLQPQQIANSIGVQAQVFIVVNVNDDDDENYYYPNLINGMIVDYDTGHGIDIAKYTGSTTGSDNFNNSMCSKYSPITWHVDRKCHIISASSFDKLCYDMLNEQNDDMSNDIQPHGSRETINNELAPNNFVHH